MKKLKINIKPLCNILLGGTIALNTVGCTRDIIKRHDEKKLNNTPIVEEIETKDEVYFNKYNLPINLHELNDHAYIEVEGLDKCTLCEGANIYFKSEWNIEEETINEKNMLVKVVSSNGKYTLVELPTGEKGYVDSGYLIKVPNLFKSEYISVDKDSRLALDAYMYDENGMYITYLRQNEECHIIKSNDNYALITLLDGRCGYVTIMSTMNIYEKINGYTFINEGTRLYSDKKLTNVYRVSDNEILYLEYIANAYAALYDTKRDIQLYVEPSQLKNNFIDVNINTQRMDCYLNYQLTETFRTRTGKDESPTYEIVSAIDDKVTDWEFTNYPGSYAKYWIVYSTEYQAGIHDLVGDDEDNYGNSSYHEWGSHGCVRTTRNAARYVYENYNVGDMVLVRKR